MMTKDMFDNRINLLQAQLIGGQITPPQYADRLRRVEKASGRCASRPPDDMYIGVGHSDYGGGFDD